MRRHATALIATLVFALGAAGCSSSSREADDGASRTTATPAAAASGTFGDLPPVCGAGDAKGSTDQGVTDDAIKIGYGDDAGFAAAPGISHELTDAMQAFVKWCNDLGGINGRTIDATYYDAKVTEVNNVWIDACPKEFYMVGQGFALDASQEPKRQECGLPSVPGYAVSPQFANGPLHHEPNPVPGDYTVISAGAQLAELFPAEIKHSAVVYGNFSATIDTRDKVLPAFETLGYRWSCAQEYNLTGEADWKPFAQKLKACGIRFVYFIGSPYPNFENLAEASAQLEFDPVWYTDPNFYNADFAKWNKNGFADRVYMRQAVTPLEEAGSNKAIKQYVDLVTADGGDVNASGAVAASAFLLWATAAKACGSDLTRACVEKHLDGIHKWTGGGLHVASDPGANLPAPCGMLMKLTGTRFERLVPKQANSFDCDPSYAFKITGDVVDRAHLDDKRIARLP